MIKVIIAEDQVVLRECLKLILEQDSEIEVVGCAGNGEDALELCNQLKPNVVLLDIVMPVCDGINSLRLIKEKYPEIKVIILTTFDNDENVQRALKYKVDGYILKDIEPSELITVIKTTMKGMQIIHHNVYNTILRQFNHNDQRNLCQESINYQLTERETDIIQMIVQGKSNKEIASNVFLSETRVKSIITNILGKFHLEDRTQLAVYVVRNQLIEKLIS